MATVSLCMIVRNEAKFLERCLDSVREHVDEMVVLDTGSTDETREIAARAGAKVFSQPWTNDFAAARNAALAHAKGSWVLQLDADERLAPGCGARLRAFVERTDRDCGLLRLHDARTLEAGATDVISGKQRLGDSICVPRLFRRQDDVAYTGVIHEEITPWLARRGMKVDFVDADIVHLGRVDEIVKSRQKRVRNAELLRQWAARDRDDYSPLAFLAMELFEAGDEEAARAAAEEGWLRLLRGRAPGFRSPLRLGVVKAALALSHGDLRGVFEITAQVRKKDGAHPDLDYLDGQAAELLALEESGRRRLRYLELARAAFTGALSLRGATYAQRFVPGSSGLEAFCRLGAISLALGDVNAAAGAFEHALALAPEHREARLGAVEVLIASGKLERALAMVEPLLGDEADGWVLAASAAHAAGAFADLGALLSAAVQRRDRFVCTHRRGTLRELAVLRAFYEGRAEPAPTAAGALVAVATRVAFAPGTPGEAPSALLRVFLENLVRLQRFAEIEPFFDRRAGALVPGAKQLAVDVLAARGIPVEDDGVPEPVVVGAANPADCELLRGLFAAHPSFDAQIVDAATTNGGRGTTERSDVRPVLIARAAFADIAAWGEAFPRARIVLWGSSEDDVSIPQDIAQRSTGIDRAKLLAAPVETLTSLFAFLGEPGHDGPLRHLVEFYPGAK